MWWQAALSPALGALTEALKLINTEETRKYLTKLYNLRKDILDEDSKGYDSDDAKIENLLKELKITLEAVENEIKLHAAKNS